MTYEVHYDSTLLHLTPKEYARFTGDQWATGHESGGYHRSHLDAPRSPHEEAVKSHIKALRQKLKTAGAADDFIETVHGLGYRMKLTP